MWVCVEGWHVFQSIPVVLNVPAVLTRTCHALDRSAGHRPTEEVNYSELHWLGIKFSVWQLDAVWVRAGSA